MEEVVQRCSVKTVCLEISQNLQENTCARVSFLIKLQAWPATLFLKKTLAQVVSCEFCDVSKNTFSYRTTLVAASGFSQSLWQQKAPMHLSSKYFNKILTFTEILWNMGTVKNESLLVLISLFSDWYEDLLCKSPYAV